jgi:hypothetical protein
VEEVLRNNPEIGRWRSRCGVEDRGVMAAFMQALGFSAHSGWERSLLNALPGYLTVAPVSAAPLGKSRVTASTPYPGYL